MEPKFVGKLNERKEKGSLRSLSSFEGLIDFCSNDYLGLGKEGAEYVKLSGSTGSRLISGNSREAESAEAFLAGFFEAESALIFNSGYDANLGLFSSVPQKGDTIIYDELIHASVRDGIRLSPAKSWSFAHSELSNLEKKIKQAEGTVFVAVESLYSMDGDFAPLKDIAEVCKRTNALLIVDEAHSGGVCGAEGRGLLHEGDLHKQCFARLVTFGKAFGSHGAVVLGPEILKQFLINFARSFIYTTALPAYQYTHIKEQAERPKTDLIEKLQRNIGLFRRGFQHKLLSDPGSPVQIVPMETAEICRQMAGSLIEKGFAVKAILPPTVHENGQRLRICLHAFNTEEEVCKLTEILNSMLAGENITEDR